MLPTATPESQGVPSGALERFLRALNSRIRYPHNVVFARHGRVVCEASWAPYAPDAPHQLFSLSKSFTSSAIGIAAGEGLLSLDDRLLSFFPEHDTPAVGPRMRRVTLRHLLTMSCGHAECPMQRFLGPDPACDLVQSFLELEPVHEPGTHFAYNSIGTYMLSAVLRRVTGENLSDWLRPRLLDPVGIGPLYSETCRCHGTDLGGWGLWASVRQLALAGQLWLQGGRWNGRQLIPEAYLREAMSWQIQNGPGSADWCQGYGYQFWQCRHRCVRGDGASGQYVVMDPRQDAVLAMNGGLRNMQEPLDLFYELLLGELAPGPLPEDPEALAGLRALERSLRSPMAGRVAARAAAAAPAPVPAPLSFAAAGNPWGLESLRIEFRPDGADLAFSLRDRPVRFGSRYGDPETSEAPMLAAGHSIAVCSNLEWLAPDHLRVVALCPGTVNRFTFDLRLGPGGAAELGVDAWIWFRHPELERGTVPLRPAR